MLQMVNLYRYCLLFFQPKPSRTTCRQQQNCNKHYQLNQEIRGSIPLVQTAKPRRLKKD